MLATGVLGLLGMSVAQRTREVGIRMALGATPARVAASIVGEQLGAVAIGLAAGATISAWTVRLIETQLYGVRAYDPGVWTAVAVTIVLVAGLSALVPSTRAMQVDPAVTLKES
jgi:ABC-type antimicrobial peptide transport system permease subunit